MDRHAGTSQHTAAAILAKVVPSANACRSDRQGRADVESPRQPRRRTRGKAMERRYVPLTPAVFAVLLLGAFLGGVFIERYNFLPGSASAPPHVGRTFAPFWEAWRLVEQHYVDRKKIDPVEMTQGAIEGMLNSLGDVGHTAYLSPEEAEAMSAGIEG